MDRFDIAEAYQVWCWDYADGRDDYWLRKQAQLRRIQFSPRPSLEYDTLTEESREVYDHIVELHS
jgi:hypothetical protein